jgi:cell division protein FtsW (lipid II flippase)
MLQLTMKCWNSSFNARGSRLFIVVLKLGSVKIYVAAVEGAQEKGKTGWNSVYHQNWWLFLSLMYFFAGLKKKISPCVWPNSGFWCCVFLTLQITLIIPTQVSQLELFNPKIPNQSVHCLSQVWKAQKANETKSG